MNLDELLKVNSVRCIKTKVQQDLVEGEIYKVEGFNDETIKIVDRNGFSSWHNKNLFEPVLNNDIDLDELVNHLVVGKNWKEVGCDHVVTITEISSDFANSTMVAFESDCCLSSSPLEMFLKDFEPRFASDFWILEGLDKAINIVREHSKCVSVDDKLPDDGVKVLAWHSRKGKFFIATYDRELKVWLNDGKPYSSEFLYSITHWTSLPSSPSEV